MYVGVLSSILVTFIYVPIRPSRRDPDADEIEDAED
jgi:hypothetical protein